MHGFASNLQFRREGEPCRKLGTRKKFDRLHIYNDIKIIDNLSQHIFSVSTLCSAQCVTLNVSLSGFLSSISAIFSCPVSNPWPTAYYTIIRWQAVKYPLYASLQTWRTAIPNLLFFWALPLIYFSTMVTGLDNVRGNSFGIKMGYSVGTIPSIDHIYSLFIVDDFRTTPWPSCSLSDNYSLSVGYIWMSTTIVFFFIPFVVFLSFGIWTLVALKVSFEQPKSNRL